MKPIDWAILFVGAAALYYLYQRQAGLATLVQTTAGNGTAPAPNPDDLNPQTLVSNLLPTLENPS